jgi:hypothetical protein
MVAVAIDPVPQYSDRIRHVNGSPKQVNATDELFPADLLDASATAKAVAGSEVTYLVAGLKYDHNVTRAEGPPNDVRSDQPRHHECRRKL